MEGRATHVERMVDCMVLRLAGAAGVAGPIANHFRITDLGWRNLRKFSGTRTLEAVNSFTTALEREF
jgi:hypothetical protein